MEYKFTDENFEQEVLNSDLPVLVDFYADWCGPCKIIAPIIEELAAEYEGKVKIGKINVDEEQNSSKKYKVMSIPTLIFFKDGEQVDKLVGVLSKDQLVEKLESFK
ncbi:MAG TPA: thioredoxin [Clostridiales bacterium]|nr:thioredoxin [Clostridiales bacterium]